MIARFTQIDGALPNLALAKLIAWHREQGDEIVFSTSPEPDLFEPRPDVVYGSSIFDFSAGRAARLRRAFPTSFISGTGTAEDGGPTVEAMIGVEPWSFERYDFSAWPDFRDSIGFTQRGCRLKCGFCRVPAKEGKPRDVNTIAAIWRGREYPKNLHILDNDFFGAPGWRDRVDEIVDGRFRVCLSQGINVRLVNEEAARALARIEYRDTRFKERRLYTAWDNLRDEKVFFRGVNVLEANGVPADRLMAYMLVGYDPGETWDRLWHRFTAMVERGISPYPMVYDAARADLKCFQRWVIARGGQYRYISWGDYRRETKSAESVKSWKPYEARLAAALPRLPRSEAEVVVNEEREEGDEHSTGS